MFRLLTFLWAGWLLLLLPQLAAAAPPTLVIKGLGSGTTDITAFVDQVQIINASTGAVVAGAVGDGSFEAVGVGGSYAYQPTGSPWTFVGAGGTGPSAGLAANGSAFSPPAAPNGTQAAFVQRTGTLRQALTLAPGTYQVQFQFAQRPGNGTPQQLSVQVLGQLVGTTSGGSTSYTQFTSGSFTVAFGLISTSPVANSNRAPRAQSAVRLTFNQSIPAYSDLTERLAVYSAQVGGGRRADGAAGARQRCASRARWPARGAIFSPASW